MTKTSIKLNHFIIGKHSDAKPMAMIYHNNYRRKSRTVVNFRFSCSKFDGHLKGQNFKTHFTGCECIERRESSNLKEPGTKKICYHD